MHQVILSLGANYQAEKNLPEARTSLGQILFSPIYTDAIWTEPIASKRSDLYLNQLVKAQTNLDFESLIKEIKDMEIRHGRTLEEREQGIVRIDIDVLEYDGVRHHLRDWQRPYVQDLLPQL
ncbi:2-amino-4-hydroxy-6-hydroxymethyldihydropteridine diphosphokinase [Prevotella sp. E2-28]|uniref:2-amino-4-hydroxy-6- hydroxymethyldihydropteridine diphosphokinase n=1 Tax=Prevotella sp. E2-28 TaxID=2913620 RepID=UPI001EDBF844|nr:2-amino-4-hydroxy-6-hydroxymethyldihydropteridine diphosphokinase [Prevotella sp. E2-28]UKK52385.1 2-amino-4-hydroxy-6-hydroxymethyldihydropteridine diphosphokinase [Prevotella sp. E2-28]